MPIFITACQVCTLILALLTVAHFNKFPGDWIAIKAAFNPVRRWWALLSWEWKQIAFWLLGGLVLLTGFMFS